LQFAIIRELPQPIRPNGGGIEADEINLEDLPSHLKLEMRTGLERWLSLVKESFDRVDFASANYDNAG
jgi:hypothetical protein